MLNLPSYLTSSRHSNLVSAIIERYLELEPGNRNAGRALLVNQANQKSQLLETCLRFFDSNCTKVSCFGDLRDFLPQLSHQEQGKFLNHIDEAAKAKNPLTAAETVDKGNESVSDSISTVYCSSFDH